MLHKKLNNWVLAAIDLRVDLIYTLIYEIKSRPDANTEPVQIAVLMNLSASISQTNYSF